MTGFALPCPNCGCDNPCVVIAVDTFASDTIANYTIVSESFGTWNVGSGKLQTPITGILRHNTTTPATPDGIRVSVVANFGGGTGKMGILVDYVDSSNFLYVELEATGSTTATLRLIDVASGSPSTLQSVGINTGFNWSNDTTILACWDDTRLVGSLGPEPSPATTLLAMPTSHGGDYIGLRHIGGQVSATFDDLVITSQEDGCDLCGGCDACDPPLFEIQLDFTGFSNVSCLDCADLNATFFLPIESPMDSCGYIITDQPCGTIQLLLSSDDIQVLIFSSTAPVWAAAFQREGDIGDCSTWNELDIPFVGPVSGAGCAATSPTCKLTAA